MLETTNPVRHRLPKWVAVATCTVVAAIAIGYGVKSFSNLSWGPPAEETRFIYTADPATLKPAPISPDWIVAGNPVAQATILSKSPDGFAFTMMWTCTPGVFDWHYTRDDETLTVLQGAVILDEGLPTERHVRAGDTVYFPAGSNARWHIIETV